VAQRWGLFLLCVCVASLAGNVYLYHLLPAGPLPGGTSSPSPKATPTTPAERRTAAASDRAPGQTTAPQTEISVGTQADQANRTASAADCERRVSDSNRSALRDPAQRQQVKQMLTSTIRRGGEADAGMKDLHLSADQLERIYELTAEWQLQSMESNDPAAMIATSQQQNPLIAAELGIEVADRWAKHQREVRARYEVQALAARVTSDDVPLTPDQRKRMAELYGTLEEQRRDETQGLEAQAPASEAEAIEQHQVTKERDERYQQKLIERAASILDAKQLEILRSESEQRAAFFEQQWELRRSQGKLVVRDERGCVMSYAP
jgi:hypothetical protein